MRQQAAADSTDGDGDIGTGDSGDANDGEEKADGDDKPDGGEEVAQQETTAVGVAAEDREGLEHKEKVRKRPCGILVISRSNNTKGVAVGISASRSEEGKVLQVDGSPVWRQLRSH